MVACRFKAMLYCRWAFDSLLSRFDCSHLRFSIFRSLYLPLFESLWLPAGTAVRPPRFPARMCTCGQGSCGWRRALTRCTTSHPTRQERRLSLACTGIGRRPTWRARKQSGTASLRSAPGKSMFWPVSVCKVGHLE